MAELLMRAQNAFGDDICVYIPFDLKDTYSELVQRVFDHISPICDTEVHDVSKASDLCFDVRRGVPSYGEKETWTAKQIGAKYSYLDIKNHEGDWLVLDHTCRVIVKHENEKIDLGIITISHDRTIFDNLLSEKLADRGLILESWDEHPTTGGYEIEVVAHPFHSRVKRALKD